MQYLHLISRVRIKKSQNQREEKTSIEPRVVPRKRPNVHAKKERKKKIKQA